MLCLRPTASIARNPAQNASAGEIRRTARSESQHAAITSGMPKSSPFAATGSISALDTRAAVATADPGGGPAYGRRVGDAGAAGELPGRGCGGEHEQGAAHRADEAVGVGAAEASVAWISQRIGGGRSTK